MLTQYTPLNKRKVLEGDYSFKTNHSDRNRSPTPQQRLAHIIRVKEAEIEALPKDFPDRVKIGKEIKNLEATIRAIDAKGEGLETFWTFTDVRPRLLIMIPELRAMGIKIPS